jgi:hypothetical protein
MGHVCDVFIVVSLTVKIISAYPFTCSFCACCDVRRLGDKYFTIFQGLSYCNQQLDDTCTVGPFKHDEAFLEDTKERRLQMAMPPDNACTL